MKNYLNRGDFLELALKVYEKGLSNLIAKFKPKAIDRTKAAFNSDISSSNWWIIPQVKARWNEKITGDPNKTYEELLINEVLIHKKDLKLLSIGCGVGNHEMKLAQIGKFAEVLGIDVANQLIEIANRKAGKLNIANCSFKTVNVLEDEIPNAPYDIVLFHSSLHHFDGIDSFLTDKIFPILAEQGLLVINEFIGPTRLQWTKNQIDVCNDLLAALPAKMRKTRLPLFTKRKVRRPGIWRMILSDPSESIDSESIYPVIHKHCTPLLEREYGGNILHLLLKDIAHNFLDDSKLVRQELQRLFEAEDTFIKGKRSDFLFGVYEVKNDALE